MSSRRAGKWLTTGVAVVVLALSACSGGAKSTGLMSHLSEIKPQNTTFQSAPAQSTAPQPTHDNNYQPFHFTGQRQLELGPLDQLGRATGAHIQLRNSDEPASGSRVGSLSKCNPVGWHQTKADGAYLWDRGHLVGYQFSGIMCTDPSEDIKNFVPETHWFNAGTVIGFDDKNQDSMVYYEDMLDKWLSDNPTDYLDYQVTPIYNGNDLLPTHIQLDFVGISPQGQTININVGGHEQEMSNNESTVMLLNGAQPGVNINYTTGELK